GPAHGAPAPPEPGQGRRPALVQQMPVDVKDGLAARPLGDHVTVPDLLEHGRHGHLLRERGARDPVKTSRAGGPRSRRTCPSPPRGDTPPPTPAPGRSRRSGGGSRAGAP